MRASTETPGPRAADRALAALRPLVVRYCRARLGPDLRAQADDVAQEVCFAVSRTLPEPPADGTLPGFVCRVAREKVAAARRAAARDRAEPVADLPEEPDSTLDPERHALHRELAERTAALLRVLPDRQREIVVLRVVVGLSAEETADVVGSTPGAVRVAQHRALNQLRRTVARQFG